jgi:DNA-binding NarL/FixJ family response regulator
MNADFHLGFLQAVRKVSKDSKLVLWVDSISTEMAFQSFNLGVRGVLRKMLAPSVFLAQLRNIRDGNLWIEKTLMNSIVSAKAVQLTRREAQLVSLLAQALKNKEIAATMNVTENTVKAYLSRLFQKLGVKDRLELALYGLKNMNGTTNPEQAAFQFNGQKQSGSVAFQSILVPQQRVGTFAD